MEKESKTILDIGVGDVFGRLTVVGFKTVQHSKKLPNYHRTTIVCRCSCGNTELKEVQAAALRRGTTTSCGCFCRERNQELREQRKKNDSFVCWRGLFGSVKSGAKARKLQFNIDLEDFVRLARSNCSYCGVAPSQKVPSNAENGSGLLYNGLDRVDNNLGYTLGNTVPACKRCNLAKHTMTIEEWQEWVKRIITYRSSLLFPPTN